MPPARHTRRLSRQINHDQEEDMWEEHSHLLPKDSEDPDSKHAASEEDDDSDSDEAYVDTDAPSPRRPHHSRQRSSDYVPRPSNPFILYRSWYSKREQQKANPETHHREISRRAGTSWRGLSAAEKLPWKLKAEEIKAAHKLQHPGYRYCPDSKSKVARHRQQKNTKAMQRSRKKVIPTSTTLRPSSVSIHYRPPRLIKPSFIDDQKEEEDEAILPQSVESSPELGYPPAATLGDTDRGSPFVPTCDIPHLQLDSGTSNPAIEEAQPQATSSTPVFAFPNLSIQAIQKAQVDSPISPTLPPTPPDEARSPESLGMFTLPSEYSAIWGALPFESLERHFYEKIMNPKLGFEEAAQLDEWFLFDNDDDMGIC